MPDPIRDQELRDYYGISEQGIAAVRAFRPVLETHLDELISDFYRHLLSFKTAHAFLADSDTRSRLLDEQRRYLLSLGDPIDEEYIRHREAIGLAHQRIGLPPQLFLGACSLYGSLILSLLSKHFAKDREQFERTYNGFHTLLFFDAQAAAQAYEEKKNAETSQLTRELTSESRQLAQNLQEQTAALHTSKERTKAVEQLATVGEMVSGLAHEIGTPMNVILTNVELLENSVQDERGVKRLSSIHFQIERITKIIRTFLDLARPAAPCFTSNSIQKVIEESLLFASEELEQHGVRVSTSFSPTPSISGDSKRLAELFTNLFINAADAVGESGELDISVEATDRSILVRVEDNGQGIDAKTLQHIFDPFFSTKPAGHGCGLGLVAAKRIAEEHGGKIHVESEVGAGTRFFVCIPIDQANGGCS